MKLREILGGLQSPNLPTKKTSFEPTLSKKKT